MAECEGNSGKVEQVAQAMRDMLGERKGDVEKDRSDKRYVCVSFVLGYQKSCWGSIC